ncbi:thioredoxin [Medicago truncatula]|uniref:Thioredoxin n=2 Tax=Medicago truncatula TaxID=3880 RepID=A0A072V3F8_MEDTR|nr:thioredoxin [Medicago truncatula]
MAEEGQVIEVHSVEAWNEQILKGNDSNKLNWLKSGQMSPSLLKVDVDELNTIAEEWEIEAMPTFLFLKEGKLVNKVVGGNKTGRE